MKENNHNGSHTYEDLKQICLEKSKELGLVDGLGNAEQVLREKYGDQIEIKKFEKSKGWFSKKLSSSENYTDKVISLLEERSIWQRYGL